MTIEELKVLITAETAGLEREINKVQGQLKGFERSVSKSTSRINNSFKSLFKGVSFTAITLGLIKVGKQASSTASALEEVQNVVQVTFGKSSAEIDDFASKALNAFGLSELSAKKMASTYMAMSNGMGITHEAGKEMSKTLTGLAGDMASFYNVSTDVANTALNSVFTGETESLKKFGVVLTEANLQAFAYSQGISKSLRDMSQSEKVMLRYQYVLKATAQAQGDFSRTSGSWANQTRILKEQWGQLLGILGKGLNAVLLPVVKAMNSLLSSVIAVANSIAKTFGGSGIQSATGKVESNLGGIQQDVGGIEGGFNGANDSAKELAKTVAGFDELNILQSPVKAGGESGGGADVGGSTEGSGTVTPTPDEPGGVSKLQKYLQECADIIKKWALTIPKLEFNFDKEKALKDLGEIGKNILNTIAGWGSFVISIAIQVANDLDIGQLTNSFLNFIRAATGLASAITDAVVPALQTFYRESGLQDIVKWIGEKLAEGLDGVAGKLDDWAKWFKDNKEQINTFAENLGKALDPISQLLIAIGNAAWSVFADTLSLINDEIRKLVDWLIKLNTEQLQILIVSLLGIIGYFKIAKAEAGFFGISLLESLAHPIQGIQTLWLYLHDYVWYEKIIPMFDGIVSGAKRMALGIVGAIKGLPGSIGKILGAIKTAVVGAVHFIMTNPIALIIAAIVALVALIAVKGDEIQGLFNKLSDYLADTFATDWTKQFGFFGEIMNGFGKVFSEVWQGISEVMNGIIDFIRGVFTGDWERAWNGVKNIFKGIWDTFVGIVKAPINIIIGLVNGLGHAVVSAFNAVKRVINTLHLHIPDWVPMFGGKSIGFNLQMSSYTPIPLLANGGVITSPTVAMMGEYAGASSNPEIVAPQSILKETISEGNSDMISAMYQMCRQMISAIENINMEVSIGDETIAQSARRGSVDYQRRTGKPLFA